MRLIISTVPQDAAKELAKNIVSEGLAACVNIVPAVQSIYIWKGKLEDDMEALLFVKTTAATVARLTGRIKELHPYDVPEIISLSINDDEGNGDYLSWVRDAVA